MLAPVASQMAESALMDEIRCASIALAANFDSSDDQRPTVKMRSVLHMRASGQSHMKPCDVLDSRNPVCVNIGQGLACTLALRRLQRPNQHPIRVEQIGDSGTLREKLGVGKYVKPDARFRVGLENGAHRFRRTHWYRGLLDDNLGSSRDGGDAACGGFDITGYYYGNESEMCY
jgi:hypothetical protein